MKVSPIIDINFMIVIVIYVLGASNTFYYQMCFLIILINIAHIYDVYR